MTWLFASYIKPLENIPKIESLRQQGIQFDIQSCAVGEESKPLRPSDERAVWLWEAWDLCVIDPK